jgi:hypothetical protein
VVVPALTYRVGVTLPIVAGVQTLTVATALSAIAPHGPVTRTQ